jgi:hypothetical protein
MTIDVAPETATSTTQLPDPLTIDFVSALFTSRNRAAKFLHKQYALTDFVHSLAKWLEKQKTQDILADIPAIATTDPVDETTIAAQIIQLLTLHLYGEQATLDAARLGNSLVDHHRRTILNHEEQYRWYFSQNPAVPSHLSSQEDCVAWNLWLGLARLFGMNTVEKCTQRLWLHHASYAPLIAAAPIELIELWLAVPSEQLPSSPLPSPRRFDHRDAEYLYSETYDGEAPAQLMRLRTGLLRCAESPAVTPKMGLVNAMRATLFVASDDRRSGLRRVVTSYVPSGVRDACGRLISTIKVQDSRVVEELLEQLHVHAWRQSGPTLHAHMRGDALTKDVLRKIDEMCEHLL